MRSIVEVETDYITFPEVMTNGAYIVLMSDWAEGVVIGTLGSNPKKDTSIGWRGTQWNMDEFTKFKGKVTIIGGLDD